MFKESGSLEFGINSFLVVDQLVTTVQERPDSRGELLWGRKSVAREVVGEYSSHRARVVNQEVEGRFKKVLEDVSARSHSADSEQDQLVLDVEDEQLMSLAHSIGSQKIKICQEQYLREVTDFSIEEIAKKYGYLRVNNWQQLQEVLGARLVTQLGFEVMGLMKRGQLYVDVGQKKVVSYDSLQLVAKARVLGKGALKEVELHQVNHTNGWMNFKNKLGSLARPADRLLSWGGGPLSMGVKLLRGGASFGKKVWQKISGQSHWGEMVIKAQGFEGLVGVDQLAQLDMELLQQAEREKKLEVVVKNQPEVVLTEQGLGYRADGRDGQEGKEEFQKAQWRLLDKKALGQEVYLEVLWKSVKVRGETFEEGLKKLLQDGDRVKVQEYLDSYLRVIDGLVNKDELSFLKFRLEQVIEEMIFEMVRAPQVSEMEVATPSWYSQLKDNVGGGLAFLKDRTQAALLSPLMGKITKTGLTLGTIVTVAGALGMTIPAVLAMMGAGGMVAGGLGIGLQFTMAAASSRKAHLQLEQAQLYLDHQQSLVSKSQEDLQIFLKLLSTANDKRVGFKELRGLKIRLLARRQDLWAILRDPLTPEVKVGAKAMLRQLVALEARFKASEDQEVANSWGDILEEAGRQILVDSKESLGKARVRDWLANKALWGGLALGSFVGLTLQYWVLGKMGEGSFESLEDLVSHEGKAEVDEALVQQLDRSVESALNGHEFFGKRAMALDDLYDEFPFLQDRTIDRLGALEGEDFWKEIDEVRAELSQRAEMEHEPPATWALNGLEEIDDKAVEGERGLVVSPSLAGSRIIENGDMLWSIGQESESEAKALGVSQENYRDALLAAKVLSEVEGEKMDPTVVDQIEVGEKIEVHKYVVEEYGQPREYVEFLFTDEDGNAREPVVFLLRDSVIEVEYQYGQEVSTTNLSFELEQFQAEQGGGASLEGSQEVQSEPEAEPLRPGVHRVEAGSSLWSISQEKQVSFEVLVDAYIEADRDPGSLRVGEELELEEIDSQRGRYLRVGVEGASGEVEYRYYFSDEQGGWSSQGLSQFSWAQALLAGDTTVDEQDREVGEEVNLEEKEVEKVQVDKQLPFNLRYLKSATGYELSELEALLQANGGLSSGESIVYSEALYDTSGSLAGLQLFQGLIGERNYVSGSDGGLVLDLSSTDAALDASDLEKQLGESRVEIIQLPDLLQDASSFLVERTSGEGLFDQEFVSPQKLLMWYGDDLDQTLYAQQYGADTVRPELARDHVFSSDLFGLTWRRNSVNDEGPASLVMGVHTGSNYDSSALPFHQVVRDLVVSSARVEQPRFSLLGVGDEARLDLRYSGQSVVVGSEVVSEFGILSPTAVPTAFYEEILLHPWRFFSDDQLDRLDPTKEYVVIFSCNYVEDDQKESGVRFDRDENNITRFRLMVWEKDD